MLSLDRFVERMTDHWRQELSNVPSAALQATWRQLAEAFNATIADSAEPLPFGKDPKWRVLNPATGTGKTESLKVYCSMLPGDEHPGVLVVVRLKEQANTLAEGINLMTGRQDAIAFHSDVNDVDPMTLKDWPVLVVCHAAFLRGLDLATRHKSNWSKFMAHKDDRRRLVVVDEALDVIEEAQADLAEIAFVKGLIPSVLDAHPKQKTLIKIVEDALEKEQRNGDGKDKLLWETYSDQIEEMLEEADFTDVMSEARRLPLDRKLIGKEDQKAKMWLLGRIERALHGVRMTLELWAWHSRKGRLTTANTARLLIPDDAPAVTLLDATAATNKVYELIPLMQLQRAPSGARNYGNVHLSVSLGHSVGRDACIKRGLDGVKEFMESLEGCLHEDRKVLLVCHKDVEPLVALYPTKFTSFATAHWGDLDGKNSWRDHDVVAVYGLPYRPPEWALNTYMATSGVEDTESIQSKGMSEIRKRLNRGQLTTDLVQAVNRVQCRRVIDAEGNCPFTNIFVWLPAGETGKAILKGLKAELPGHFQMPWRVTAGASKARPKFNYADALVTLARNMDKGGQRYSVSIRDELKMPSKRWEKLATEMVDATTNLAQRLAEVGVSYLVRREGKRNRAYLVKAA
jgi:hypothetical protein